MRHASSALIVSLLTVALLAGCIGGDGLDGGIPRAVVTMEEVPGKADTFFFDASRSTGTGLGFDWDFGDGTKSNEPQVEHTYAYGSGTYTVRLIITDAAGTSDLWTESVMIGDGTNAPPTAFFSLPKRIFSVEEPVRVDAGASFDPEGDPLEYRWEFNYITSFSDYEDFRAKKADADWEDLEDGKSLDNIPLPVPLPDDPLGYKHPGHGGDDGSDFTPSLFFHNTVTTEPVYTLESGFPEQTVFFIRLQTVDIKGGYADIVSEEIWPVLVDNNPPARYVNGAYSDTFTFGAPASVTNEMPTGEPWDELYKFDHALTFVTDYPADLAYVNVTFNENPIAEAAGELNNALRLDVRPPDFSDAWSSEDTGGRLSIEFQGQDEPGTGTWEVFLIARSGYDIEWEITYWAKVDINPFRALEAPFL